MALAIHKLKAVEVKDGITIDEFQTAVRDARSEAGVPANAEVRITTGVGMSVIEMTWSKSADEHALLIAEANALVGMDSTK